MSLSYTLEFRLSFAFQKLNKPNKMVPDRTTMALSKYLLWGSLVSSAQFSLASCFKTTDEQHDCLEIQRLNCLNCAYLKTVCYLDD